MEMDDPQIDMQPALGPLFRPLLVLVGKVIFQCNILGCKYQSTQQRRVCFLQWGKERGVHFFKLPILLYGAVRAKRRWTHTL